MRSAKEGTMTADERRKRAKQKIAKLLAELRRLAHELGQCSQDAAAVEAVVGEEDDARFDDVDPHPGSLDLPPALNRGRRRTS